MDITAEIREAITELLLRDRRTFNQLLHAAQNNLGKYELHHLYSPQDIFNMVVLKLLTGERVWDKVKYPDINKYLFVVIVSQVRNISKTEKPTIRLKYDDSSSGDDPGMFGIDDKEFIENCLSKLRHEKELQAIFLEFTKGAKNRDVVKSLTLDIRTVESAKKRIRRKLQPLFEEYLE